MIEQLLQLPRMTILQCQEVAKKLGFDSVTFDLCGPEAKASCRWIDAYLGFFEAQGRDGFMRAADLGLVPDIWCENVMPRF